uniref:non-specific serine/threonine protein kinase n=1 Tax=Ditylenchus dipsaci TaxID=166011 RepID=A0A915DLP8_9BILA
MASSTTLVECEASTSRINGHAQMPTALSTNLLAISAKAGSEPRWNSRLMKPGFGLPPLPPIIPPINHGPGIMYTPNVYLPNGMHPANVPQPMPFAARNCQAPPLFAIPPPPMFNRGSCNMQTSQPQQYHPMQYRASSSSSSSASASQSASIPYTFPPPPLPPNQLYGGPAPSLLIAQPININLEVKPFSSAPPSGVWQGCSSSSSATIPPAIIKIMPSSMIEIDCWNTAVSGWEQATLIKNKIDLVINKRYKIVQSIASGSYGAIFVAEDLMSGSAKHRVAVKFDAACKDDHLKYEFDVYKSVLYDDGTGKVEGFPQVYWYGHEFGHNIMVMELLGAPLASLFAFCDRKFGKQTIVSLGEQMIHRIRHLHQRGFIHRDIKPENFLIGLSDKENTCYLIDFGLARRYRYRENRRLKHIPFRKGRSFVGTAKYASVNSHKSIELSRRDDLESLGYVLIELINGSVPWKNISKRTAITRQQTSIRIRNVKEQTNWAETCPSMAPFIQYCRDLPFADDPDYEVLLNFLQGIVMPNDTAEKGSTKIPSDNIRCENCEASLLNNTQPLLPSKEHVPKPTAEQLVVTEPTLKLELPSGSVGIPQITTTPTGNLLCQIPCTFIQPVVECAEVMANNLANLSLATDLNIVACPLTDSLPTTSSTSAALEEDAESTGSCHKCRERLQLFFDQQQDQQSKPLPKSENNDAKVTKMSWQIWRESNVDRRFQYENRFSWTLPEVLASVRNTPPLASAIAPTSGLMHLAFPPPPYQMCNGNMGQPMRHVPIQQPVISLARQPCVNTFVCK